MIKNNNITIITAGTMGTEASYARMIALMSNIKKRGVFVQIVSQFAGREKPKQSTRVGGISVRYFSFYPKPPDRFIRRLLKVIVGHLQLFFFMLFSTTKKDILFFYCPTAFTIIPALRLANVLNRKTVTDIVELFQHQKNTWYNRLGDKWAFKYATIPFAISDRLIEYGKKQTNKKIVKLPIVVDFERFNPNIKPLHKLIGYVGTSAVKDGLDIVLKGFAEATNTDKQLKLLLIGPKPTFFNFDALVAQLNLAEKIEITGSINFEKIPSLLLTCDSFVMNRDNALFAQYGYPTKLGEYFACNRPVLMSDGLGFSEDFTDKVEAIKYEVNNPQALAEAIKWRYENESKAQIIAQKGYDYGKKHFSKEVVGEIFVNRLKNL